MCLSPIKLRNPTKRISLFGGQPLSIQVACGHCAECIKQKRNEWYFRSYQETQNILRCGGYIYFDTLTYSPFHLPMLSDFVDIDKYNCKDFSCFNHVHFKLFLKRLRRRLDYSYKNVSFRYFLTSEYGCDDRFTHRPHYHILFYVYANPEVLHPMEFSRLVAECWEYGRTDGIDYQPYAHVAKHVYGVNVGIGNNSSFDVISKACNYVSKYVSKDSTFSKILVNRIEYLKKHINDDDIINEVRRNIDMFHRQSKGFGLSFLDNLSNDDVTNIYNGCVTMSDSSKVVNIIPLPMYYKRHLFYDALRRDDGSYYWQLNTKGIEYYEQYLYKQIQHQSYRFYNISLNASREARYIIDKLLAGRTFDEFSIYNLFYRGRLRHSDSYSLRSLCANNSLSDSEYNLYDNVQCILRSTQYNTDNVNTISKTDFYVEIPEYGSIADIFDNQCITKKSINYETFIKLFTFNENSDIQFKNFDTLNSYIDLITKSSKSNKQTTFDFKEEYEKKLKTLIYGRKIS